MCVELSQLREGMKNYASSFDAALISAADASRVVDHASAIEKMAAAVKASAAARTAQTEIWKKEGDRSAAHHLARTTGSSLGQAQTALETARRLEKLPEASAAARRGELSPAQAAAVANAATADPGAEARLVEKARKASLSDLRDECARTKAAADPDLEARRRRIHANRSVRRWSDEEGVGHLHWSDNPEALAAFAAVLDPITEEKFAAARAEGRRERHEAYAADAMAELARRAAAATSGDATDQPGAGTPNAGTPGAGTPEADAGMGSEGETSDEAGAGTASPAAETSSAGPSDVGAAQPVPAGRSAVVPPGGDGAVVPPGGDGVVASPGAATTVVPTPGASRPRVSETKIIIRVDFGALFRVTRLRERPARSWGSGRWRCRPCGRFSSRETHFWLR